MKRLSAVIILLCAAIPASAQMYKWVDSNGKVHYSDSPPPRGTAAETMRTPARTATTTDGKSDAPKDSAKTGPKTAAEQELDFRKRRQDAAKTQADTDKKAAEARNKEENCKRAKAVLASLEVGGRQVRMDEKGERTYLNDAQIAGEKTRVENEVAKICS